MTEFKQDKPIYMQLADRLCDEIILGKYKADERIPSVREFSALLGVNTSTIVKTYDFLSASGIIYTRRGLGFFVAPEALQIIVDNRRDKFFEVAVPEFFRQMKLLGISIEKIDELWTTTEGSSDK